MTIIWCDENDDMGWEFPCLFTQPLQTDCGNESFAKKTVNLQIDRDDLVHMMMKIIIND